MKKAARVVLAQRALPVRPPGTQTSAGAGGNKIVTWVTKLLPEVKNFLLAISVLDQPGPPPCVFFDSDGFPAPLPPITSRGNRNTATSQLWYLNLHSNSEGIEMSLERATKMKFSRGGLKATERVRRVVNQLKAGTRTGSAADPVDIDEERAAEGVQANIDPLFLIAESRAGSMPRVLS